MALRKPFVRNTTKGFHEELPVSDTLDVGAIEINASGTGINMNSKKITGMADGTASGDGVNFGQLNKAVIQGAKVKELLLHQSQLDNTDGINAAVALTMAVNPSSGDTIVLTDGTTTRTYGAGSGGDVQYTIGATVADTMQNLASAIEGDGSAIWGAVFTTDLDSIDADGVVVIIEDANSGTAPEIYGTWATQANCQIVDFGGEVEYTKKTTSALPSSDPASTNFGFRRVQADLVPGEVHWIENNDVAYSWDSDADIWVTATGTGSIPDATSASGGGTKGKVTFDSDFGLSVTSGVAKIDVAASSGIKFVSGQIAVEPNDIAGTGLEDDGADNLRLTTQGNGIAGGGGSLLSVDPDSETGGNTQPVSVGANGVGLDVSAIAGTGLEADGSANLRLATQGNGISGGGGSLLSVDPDSETGGDIQPVNVTVNGVGLDIAAIAGNGLVADGSANLDINLESTTPTLQISSDELGLKIKPSGGLAVDASGVYVSGSDEATKIENTLTTATDATANGDPVYINGNNTVGKARADDDDKAQLIGVIRTGGGAAGATPEVVSHGLCAGILSGATANTPYFLQSTGGIGTSIPSGNERVIQVGYALNATDLWVEKTDFGKKAA